MWSFPGFIGGRCLLCSGPLVVIGNKEVGPFPDGEIVVMHISRCRVSQHRQRVMPPALPNVRVPFGPLVGPLPFDQYALTTDDR